MRRIVAVAALAQQDLFAALGNHTDRWINHAVNRLERHGTASQMQSWQWLFYPIFAYGSPDPLHQFLTVGLAHQGLAFSLLVISSFHRNPFSCCARIQLEELQNPPIILDDHSITLCSGVS